jgi:predicted small lipoprotein YifL
VVLRAAAALLALALLAGCGSKGTVTNDDDVARRAVEQTVERFFVAIHDGRTAAACALVPGQQRGALGRLSASRGGSPTCAEALKTLREFAPARAPGTLSVHHDLGFRSALPHRSKKAVDRVSIGGKDLGLIGLTRTDGVWRLALVCSCE